MRACTPGQWFAVLRVRPVRTVGTVEYPGVPEVGLQITRPQAPLRFKHSNAVGMTAWRGAVCDSDPNASSRLGYFMPYGLY